MMDLIAHIHSAFGARPYPGDENITCCSYSKAHPCLECEEIAEYFKGRSWGSLTGEELRLNGQSAGLFTIAAYCYFLPAYLTAAIREPAAADVCVEGLAYEFGPRDNDAWGQERLAQLLRELNAAERQAVLDYFRFAMTRHPEQDAFGGGFYARAVRNLEASL